MIKLNQNYDGPHAYSDALTVTHWNNTQWLLEYVEHNNDTNGGRWSDWSDAEHIRTTYEIEDSEGPTGRYADIGERGAAILNAAIAGKDYGAMMADWDAEIGGHGA